MKSIWEKWLRCVLALRPELLSRWPIKQPHLSSRWDQSVCWCSGIFINCLCFSVALISWGRGLWGTDRWLDGWIIYLSGVKGHGMAVRAGISWYSQRWRDVRLYIPDPLTCLIWGTGCTEWVVQDLKMKRFTAELSGKTQNNLKCRFPDEELNHCTLRSVVSYPISSRTLCLFLLQLETVIQRNIRPDTANIPSHVVHNQTATMLEIGTNLLTHTAEQTRKLNVVEAKVTITRNCHMNGFSLIGWLCYLKARFEGLMRFLPPGAEPNVSDRDPTSREFSVHQQAGERAVTADDWDQPATRQEQVEKSFILHLSECVRLHVFDVRLWKHSKKSN